MPTMQEVRAKFPQYDDMDDETLAGALHRKFYSDIPEAEFPHEDRLGGPGRTRADVATVEHATSSAA